MASFTPRSWERAAGAIMTTDTFPKGAQALAHVDGHPVRIAGIAKGSGMIAPNMATMLAFVATDAAIEPRALQTLVRRMTLRTFNSVTVDGDRSTNDTLLVFATGQSAAPPIATAEDPRLSDNAPKTEASAAKIARTIAESPLVKTAFAGEDANWGRIVMAVGRADEPIKRERISVAFGPLWAARDGAVAADYSEAAMSDYMKSAELEVRVDVGVGRAAWTMWTCDLTKQYVAINGDYRS